MKKVLLYLVTLCMLVVPFTVFAANEVKTKIVIGNTPDSESEKDSKTGYVTRVYTISLGAELTEENAETAITEAALTFDWDSAVKEVKCLDNGEFKATQTEKKCTFAYTNADATKQAAGQKITKENNPIKVGKIAVLVDPKDENCEIRYIYNGAKGTITKTNPPTGSFAPYAFIAGGLVLAAGIYFVTKKNTKIQKI